jgi:hypothetical protein
MQQFTKSMFSWGWAMSVFGMQQAIDIAGGLTGAKDGAATAARRFDNVAAAATAEVGQSMRAALDTGNNLQRGMVDALFSGMSMMDPQRWRKMAPNAPCPGSGAAPAGGDHSQPSGASMPPNPFAARGPSAT